MWPQLLSCKRGIKGHFRAAVGLPAGTSPRPPETSVRANLPFLMVFLPSRWSSTGSTVSPMSSISSVCPSETACSMVSR